MPGSRCSSRRGCMDATSKQSFIKYRTQDRIVPKLFVLHRCIALLPCKCRAVHGSGLRASCRLQRAAWHAVLGFIDASIKAATQPVHIVPLLRLACTYARLLRHCCASRQCTCQLASWAATHHGCLAPGRAPAAVYSCCCCCSLPHVQASSRAAEPGSKAPASKQCT